MSFSDSEDMIKPVAFSNMQKYFGDDEVAFNRFYDGIESKNKDKFLRLVNFYKIYICDLEKTPENARSQYEFIAFFCLIEALMEDQPYQEFYPWLCKQKTFPIAKKQDLANLFSSYNSQFGAGHRARQFFHSFIDNEDKVLFIHDFELSEDNDSVWCSLDDSEWIKEQIEKRIKFAYDMRSNFVHRAIRIPMPSPGVTNMIALVGKGRDSQLATISFNSRTLISIFERGFLRYFGYTDRFDHSIYYQEYERWLGERHSHGDLSFDDYCNKVEEIEKLTGGSNAV